MKVVLIIQAEFDSLRDASIIHRLTSSNSVKSVIELMSRDVYDDKRD